VSEEERRENAAKIIDEIASNAATFTAIFSQVPGMGMATLTKYYLELAKKIAGLFEQELEVQAATSLVISACECNKQAIFNKSVLGWIPLVGNAVNAKITFDLSKNIGWFIYDYFDRLKAKR